MPGRRRAGCACCERRGRSSSRSSCSTTQSRRARTPEWVAGPRRRGERRADECLAGGARRDRTRDPAADRRRPSPLRDGARLSRRAPGGDAHLRRPGLRASARARDLPDSPRRAGGRRRRRRAGRLHRRAALRSIATARSRASRPDDDFGPRVVESLAPEGVTYTPYAADAIAAVDSGEAAAAFLLEPVTVEQVSRFAHAGETMPQKSTFFYPKLTSGLLFHPVGRRTGSSSAAPPATTSRWCSPSCRAAPNGSRSSAPG